MDPGIRVPAENQIRGVWTPIRFRSKMDPGIAVPVENQIRGLNSNKVPAGNWIRGKTPICYWRLLSKIDSGMQGSGRKLNSG